MCRILSCTFAITYRAVKHMYIWISAVVTVSLIHLRFYLLHIRLAVESRNGKIYKDHVNIENLTLNHQNFHFSRWNCVSILLLLLLLSLSKNGVSSLIGFLRFMCKTIDRHRCKNLNVINSITQDKTKTIWLQINILK